MSRLCCGILASALGFGLLGGTARTQNEGKQKKSVPEQKEPSQNGSKTPVKPALSLDDFKIPKNLIVVVSKNLEEAKKIIPDYFVISPERYQEYQKLEEKIKELQKQLSPDRISPYSCKLSGRLHGNFIELTAEFELVTSKPNALVELGCRGGLLINAKLNDQFPFLQHTGAGYVVQVPESGKHDLYLDLKVPVKNRRAENLGGGIERHFTVGLPAVAVPRAFELRLPKDIKELRWNDYSEKKAALQGNFRLWKIPLLAEDANSLKVSWNESPAPAPGKGALQTAEWIVTSRLLQTHVLTTAKLTLHDPQAKTTQWRLLLPSGAKIETSDIETPPEPEPGKQFKETTLYRIKTPPSQQHQITVTMEQDKEGAPSIPVGPFIVLEAERQLGTFEIRAASEVLRGLGVTYDKHGDLRAEELPDTNAAKKNSDLVDLFKSWDLTHGVNKRSLKSANGLSKIGPHLEMEFKNLPAQIETWVEHTLRMQRAEAGWQVVAVSKIHTTPLFGVDYLDIKVPAPHPPLLPPVGNGSLFPGELLTKALWLHELGQWPVIVEPPGFTLIPVGAPAPADLLPLNRQNSVRRIDLKQQQNAPFHVTLTGKYWISPALQQARLFLPKPVTLSDKGAKVTVILEDDDHELVVVDRKESTTSAKHHHQFSTYWTFTPEKVHLAWKQYEPQVPTEIVADVNLHQSHASVRQQIEFDLSQLRSSTQETNSSTRAYRITLEIPEGVKSIRVVSGGTLLEMDARKRSASLEVSAQAALELEYDCSIPAIWNKRQVQAEDAPEQAAGEEKILAFNLPLVWPKQASQARIKVRVWALPGSTLSVREKTSAQAVWNDVGAEVVPGRDRLPALVVETDQLQPSLELQVQPSKLPPPTSILVKKVLYQAVLGKDGRRYFRARFRLSRIDAKSLVVSLPAPLAQLKENSLLILLDGKKVSWQAVPGGDAARLSLNPSLYRQPAILDVSFELGGDRTGALHFWQVLLRPPALQGVAVTASARWQILMPSSEVPLVLGHVLPSAQQWRWQGWLFTPYSQVSGDDLESWIAERPVQPGAPHPEGLVFWGSGTDSIRLLIVPRLVWLLLCSGAVLLLGLGMSFVPLRRFSWWLLLTGAAIGLLVLSMVWPMLVAPLIYGVQPGIVVLFLILLVQWFLHERYRRQIIFMPGFTRLPQGSSVTRQGSGKPREASTADVQPEPRGSSMVGSATDGQ